MQEYNVTYYKYTPRFVLALASFFIFIFITAFLFVQIIVARYKTRKLFRRLVNSDESQAIPATQKKELRFATVGIYIPLIVGGLFETFGYLAKMFSLNDVKASGPYAAQSVLIVVAPCLICFTLFMQFYRAIRFLNCPSSSRVSFFVKNSLMFKVLVTSNVVSFILQVLGGGLVCEDSYLGTSRVLLLFCFVVQMLNLGVFLLVQINFLVRHTKYSAENYCNTIDKNWLVLNYCTVGSSSFILIRTIVRFVDIFISWNRKTASYEVLLFLFEAVFMMIAMVLVAVPFFFVHLGTLYVWYCSYTKESSQDKTEEEELYDKAHREIL